RAYAQCHEIPCDHGTFNARLCRGNERVDAPPEIDFVGGFELPLADDRNNGLACHGKNAPRTPCSGRNIQRRKLSADLNVGKCPRLSHPRTSFAQVQVANTRLLNEMGQDWIAESNPPPGFDLTVTARSEPLPWNRWWITVGTIDRGACRQ